MACAIRNTPAIHGIKLPDCEGQPVKEAKICMFADDTQLLNKNEESVEQSFFNDFKVFPLKVKFLVFQTRVQLLILFRIFFPNVISVYIVPVKIS
jgi:hypothetical protein